MWVSESIAGKSGASYQFPRLDEAQACFGIYGNCVKNIFQTIEQLTDLRHSNTEYKEISNG
jgi:hypothetical protein